MIVRAIRNMPLGYSVRPGRSQDCEEFIGLERGAADEPAVDVGHREQIRRIAGLDAAAISPEPSPSLFVPSTAANPSNPSAQTVTSP